ncbi:FlhB-like flagellar biosynthesis protein [Bacillus sp. NPDC077027]|uniref:FlhB-like flagellar biosynthesis protein n=1 Tax=Bacillus sp. NPDC077027 TaxID=3390548 RepID=UPI003D01DAF3
MKDSKPLRRAVALHYDEEKQKSPKVIATGTGLVADNIIEEAKKSGVPIQEDPNLVELMRHLTLDEEIPEALYDTVAEIFSFIYKLDKKMKK